MIKIEHTEVLGWGHAIRGMRNPMNSWEKSDSGPCMTHGPAHCIDCPYPEGSCDASEYDLNRLWIVGPNDHDLMLKLSEAGTDHAKFRRMITVYVDLTAPLYWWKEFDTYKVGTVANSCSTMHKIAEKEFVMADFSHEQLLGEIDNGLIAEGSPLDYLRHTVAALNNYRDAYLETKNKIYWWQLIQLLPSSYNQKRTVMLNYEALANIYKSRKDHKFDEWRELCKWIETLPYSEIITGKEIKKC